VSIVIEKNGYTLLEGLERKKELEKCAKANNTSLEEGP
jgi:hypothetical protein